MHTKVRDTGQLEFVISYINICQLKSVDYPLFDLFIRVVDSQLIKSY